MAKTQITVKEVEEKTFQELKAEAVRRKLTVGTALTLAIENWLSSLKKPKESLLKWKPTNWGPGTERLSEQVDEVLYGDD
ncbi:MAG TPA: hypothetical protein VJG30_04240 [Candidatus Nanoarchaeia archaeon]|nr:hypothetical protein [Candidatus Nanoarchaeia archaeon]